MIRLHAVVPRGSTSKDDWGLRRHDAGAVTVLYEETAEPPAGTRAAVVEHGRRVVALADRVPLLPMRYGTTLEDVDELRTVAEDRADAWGRRLTQLTGRCELVVHVTVEAGPEPVQPDGSGRAYLRRRMGQVRRQDDALDDVRTVMSRWSKELRLLPDGNRLAVLVSRADADVTRAIVEAWGRSRADVEVVVTGPWPPFSFCEELS
jgi:hypothetical protein